MNIKAKIAAGVVAGLIAGTALMGAAFAAPRARDGSPFNGFRMMGSITASGTVGSPTIGQMRSFMNRYRTASGGIDMNRMHNDVVSGRVTPPCLSGQQRTNGASAGTGTGYGMMGGGY
jgi:hypothetical protein